jgi:hypothetical protein
MKAYVRKLVPGRTVWGDQIPRDRFEQLDGIAAPLVEAADILRINSRLWSGSLSTEFGS